MRARERREAIRLKKVKHTLAVQISDDADVITPVEGVSKVYALVAVGFVVLGERVQDPEFYSRGVSVFLHSPDDLDGDLFSRSSIIGLDDFSKGALTEEADNGVYKEAHSQWRTEVATTARTYIAR
jgi:hypothetical protein